MHYMLLFTDMDMDLDDTTSHVKTQNYRVVLIILIHLGIPQSELSENPLKIYHTNERNYTDTVALIWSYGS